MACFFCWLFFFVLCCPFVSFRCTSIFFFMNIVPITFLIRCVSFVYGKFCEGCECKKIKTPVTRARESRLLVSFLRTLFRTKGALQSFLWWKKEKLRHLLKNLGVFYESVGDKFMNVRLSLSPLLGKLNFRRIKEVCIWRNPQNLVPLQMWETGKS